MGTESGAVPTGTNTLVQYDAGGGNTKYAVKNADGGTNTYYDVTLDASGNANINYSTATKITGKTDSDFSTAVVINKPAVDAVTVKGLASGEELHKFNDGSGTDKYIVKTTDTAGKTIYKDATVAADGKVTATTENTNVINPLKQLDDALSQVDGLRSSLGAVQNRFDSVINNLNSTVNNLTASQSRIQDADYATEVSNMSRANILQQAGTSVLAQANQSTQNVLTLLR